MRPLGRKIVSSLRGSYDDDDDDAPAALDGPGAAAKLEVDATGDSSTGITSRSAAVGGSSMLMASGDEEGDR